MSIKSSRQANAKHAKLVVYENIKKPEPTIYEIYKIVPLYQGPTLIIRGPGSTRNWMQACCRLFWHHHYHVHRPHYFVIVIFVTVTISHLLLTQTCCCLISWLARPIPVTGVSGMFCCFVVLLFCCFEMHRRDSQSVSSCQHLPFRATLTSRTMMLTGSSCLDAFQPKHVNNNRLCSER